MTLPNHGHWPRPQMTDHVRTALRITLSQRPCDIGPSVDVVLEAIADEYGLDPDEIIARTRRQPIAAARQVVTHLLRITTPLTPSKPSGKLLVAATTPPCTTPSVSSKAAAPTTAPSMPALSGSRSR